MNPFDPLKATLLDLDRALAPQKIPLIVGGGFGLYLKQMHLATEGTRTLLTELPEPRATNDIDLFLRVDIVARLDAMQQLAAALNALAFSAVEAGKFFQWERELESGHKVRLDLLVGPLGEHREQLKTDKPPRVRPKGNIQLHAHLTDEAIEIDTRSAAIPINGLCSDGASHTVSILVPQPFTYLMMKLLAYFDRKDDAAKDVGRHHAMDLYRIVAMMTEGEYKEAIALGKQYLDDSRVARAQSIINEQFSQPSLLGMLRLREHASFREGLQLDEFMATLREVFFQ